MTQDADPTACLGLYRKLAGAVTVVTSHGRGPVGLTASSVTSVSLHPPLLLVCVATGSATLAAICSTRVFAVHLLRDDQRAMAEAFGRPGRDPQLFASLGYEYRLGVPVLVDALAWSVCRLVDAREYGDHRVVVGQIAATGVGGGRPLVWHDRHYSRLCDCSG